MSFLSNDFHAGDDSTNQARVNQAAVQTQDAMAMQKKFAEAAGAQGGLQNQSSVFNQMQGIASGTGPNPAAAMLNQATGANTANQAALMAGQRGASANPALMARQAAMQGGANQQGAAGQAATMQANQSLGALNQMGGIAGQQVGQQAQATMGYGQQAQGNQGQMMQNQQAANTINADVAKQNTSTAGSLVGGIMQGVGSVAMMSDERQKQNIRPADGKVEDMMSKMGAHEYSYKSPDLAGAGPGKHVSPMAQELEQSEVGAQMVQDTPQGKMVDYGKGFGALAAAAANLHKRLEALEKGQKMAAGGVVGRPELDPDKAAVIRGQFGGDPTVQQPGTPTYMDQGSDPSGALERERQAGMASFAAQKASQAEAQAMVDAENKAMGLADGGMAATDDTFAPASDGVRFHQGGMNYAAGGMTPGAPGDSTAPPSFLSQWGAASKLAPDFGGNDAQGNPTQLKKGVSSLVGGAAAGISNILSGIGGTPAAAGTTDTGAGAAGVAKGPNVMMAARGGNVGSKLKAGGHVPGKASVKGDSLKNDTIDAKLSPGEIVIPRSITTGPDAPRKAADFVSAILAKQGMKSRKKA